MPAVIIDTIGDCYADTYPFLWSSDGGLASLLFSLMYKGVMSLSYNRMNADVLTMSNANKLDGGIWKLELEEIVVFIAVPFSTKRESICMNTTEDRIAQSHIGSNLSMHFTSSTCVMVQRYHGFAVSVPLFNSLPRKRLQG